MKGDPPMTLDCYTARALVDANMMPIGEYIQEYGTIEEPEHRPRLKQLLRSSRRPYFARERRQRRKAEAYCH